MPTYKVPKAEDKEYIELSTAFIDKYMPKADGGLVKVYLLGLRQCFAKNPLTLKGMAKALNMLLSDVRGAWFYWESLGVVKLTPSKDDEFDISFEMIETDSKKPEVTYTKTRPSYTGGDIQQGVRDNAMLHSLFERVQAILGKPLSTPATGTLYSFYDWLQLPIEVILLLVTYCAGLGKTDMPKIEAEAIKWHEKGIDTIEKAEEHLKQIELFYSDVGKIQRKLGIQGRMLTDSEKKYIAKWMKEWDIPLEIILYAAEVTIGNTGKAAFAYMDKILQNMHEQGVKTVKQAELLRKAGKPTAKGTAAQPAKPTTKGVSTFSGKPIDFEGIEKKAREMLYNKQKAEEG